MEPAAICTAPASPLTRTGATETSVVREPIPNWPLLLLPQDHTVPSLLSASRCIVPSATASAPDIPVTWTGTERFSVPQPCQPSGGGIRMVPHSQTVPSEPTARL